MGHTKGPWEVHKCKCGHESCDTWYVSSGTFYQGSGFNKLDALLVAAAPELLKLLKLARIIADDAGYRPLEHGTFENVYADLLREIDSAIAKAEGREGA